MSAVTLENVETKLHYRRMYQNGDVVVTESVWGHDSKLHFLITDYNEDTYEYSVVCLQSSGENLKFWSFGQAGNISAFSLDGIVKKVI